MEFFGRTILKDFKGHGLFEGKVIDYERGCGYRVLYEDGDTEYLKRESLMMLFDKTARLKKEREKPGRGRTARAEPLIPAASCPPPAIPFHPSATGGSRSFDEFVKRARDAARRKRKHTELQSKAVARARLQPPAPPKARVVEEEARLPLMKPPPWALQISREARSVRVDAENTWGTTPDVHDDLTLFHLELQWLSLTAVTVKWTYPPATPGNSSSWIGLFPASCVTWQSEYGEVSSGSAKLAFRTITQNVKQGAVNFGGRVIPSAPDGEYVFTLQKDYGVRCVAVSERFSIKDGKVIGCFAGTALVTEDDDEVDHKQRQRDKCLQLLVQRSTSRAGGEATEEEVDSRCYFPLCSVDVCLSREYDTALLKAVYRIVDKESYLDWGLSSDFESVQGAEERGGYHVRNRREVIPAAGEEGVMPPRLDGNSTGEARPKMVLGLGGGALGSEGYGEATMGSVHRIGIVLQHLRELVLRDVYPDGWGLLWDLGPWSSFLDVGSGYGKVVLHLRLLAGMHSSVGVECVLSRHQIALRAKQLCEVEALASSSLPSQARSSRKRASAPKEECKIGITKSEAYSRSPSSASLASADIAPSGSGACAGTQHCAEVDVESDAPTAHSATSASGTTSPDDVAGSPSSGESLARSEGTGTATNAHIAHMDKVNVPFGTTNRCAAGNTAIIGGGMVPVIDEGKFDGVDFRHCDVTVEAALTYTHIYIFDWVFSKPTLRKMAKLLQNSPFYVLVSFRKPAEWWSYGLVKAQPIAKVQGFRTTGNESMTAFVYINLEKVPGRSTS